MSRYTFYCRAPGGTAAYFETQDLASTEAARAWAKRLLAEHRTCDKVEVLEGEQALLVVSGEISATATEAQSDIIAAALGAAQLSHDEIAVIATDIEGAVTHWNRAATRLYGWLPREALGRGILDLTPAIQSRADAAHVMATLRAGQSWQGEMVLRRRDGSPFRAFVADIPVGDVRSGGGAIVGLSVPVDERRLLDVDLGAVGHQLRRRFGQERAAGADPCRPLA